MTSTDLAEAVRRAAEADELLIALDFDGTLAPLVDEPMTARMLPAARSALTDLSAAPHTTVALVSGRTLEHLVEISEHDAHSRIHLAGSHGAEFWHPAADDSRAAGGGDDTSDGEAGGRDDRARDDLIARAEAAVADLAGVWIERKRFGLGLHTRLAERSAAAEAVSRVDALISDAAPSWRRRTGQDILEFASRHEGKDSAVTALRERVGASVVLFAGDDVTDEDALAALRPDDIGIRVGPGDTSAGYRVGDAAALADVLIAIAEARGA